MVPNEVVPLGAHARPEGDERATVGHQQPVDALRGARLGRVAKMVESGQAGQRVPMPLPEGEPEASAGPPRSAGARSRSAQATEAGRRSEPGRDRRS